MRAGLLDRVVTIQAPTVTPDEYGTPGTVWNTFATVRAQLLQRSTAEYMLKELGEETDIVTAFRIRWLDGVTLAMRVAYNGVNYRIVDIKEIGRREALELRTLAVQA